MERPFRFNHACVADLNRAWLRVVADLGNRPGGTVDQIDEKFVELSFSNDAVNRNLDHSFSSTRLVVSPFRGLGCRDQLGVPGPAKDLRRLRLLPFVSAQPRSLLPHCVPTPLN